MNTNAPGQLLGYSIQYPRALCHLLRADPGSSVCIEVLGDVSTTSSTGEVLAEEDKSSVNGNPLTDRSVDLWKSFSNWVDAVKNKKLDVSSTKFVLFRNKSGKTGIVDAFDAAKTAQEAAQALEKAKSQLSDIDTKHEAWTYYNNAVFLHSDVLLKIIEHFNLETGKGAGYKEVRLEVTKKHLPASQIDFVIENLNGWLVKLVSERIAAKQIPQITWDEFNAQFLVLFERARQRELIDFTLHTPPSDEHVNSHLISRPKYIKQLDCIKSSDEEILEAVTNYLRAKINRDKWIETGIIDENVALEFENNLRSYWRNAKKKIELTNANLSNEDKGQLLLSECQSRTEAIRGNNPPSSTIAGTYHALADIPSIGWHPDWLALSKHWG